MGEQTTAATLSLIISPRTMFVIILSSSYKSIATSSLVFHERNRGAEGDILTVGRKKISLEVRYCFESESASELVVEKSEIRS